MPRRDQFKTKEEYAAYFREYRKKNADKIREYKRKNNQERRKKVGYEPEYKWKMNNKHKVSAHQAVYRALKKGELKKMPCEVCKSVQSVAHHNDYSKWLEVVWLCKIHHREMHYADVLSTPSEPQASV